MIKTNSKTLKRIGGFHGGLVVKSPRANAEDNGSTCGSERSPGEKMTAHPSILAWRIPWTEEPGWLQSTGSQMGWTRFSD